MANDLLNELFLRVTSLEKMVAEMARWTHFVPEKSGQRKLDITGNQDDITYREDVTDNQLEVEDVVKIEPVEEMMEHNDQIVSSLESSEDENSSLFNNIPDPLGDIPEYSGVNYNSVAKTESDTHIESSFQGEDNNFDTESVNVSENSIPQSSMVVPLFNVKEIILQSDRDKGSSEGEQMLEQIMHENTASFRIKSLIKKRAVNYLVKQYTIYPPRHVKQNLAECIATQLFGHLGEIEQLDIKSLFYSDYKYIGKEEVGVGEGRKKYKSIPATGLIEDRLKYLRNKNKISIRKRQKVDK